MFISFTSVMKDARFLTWAQNAEVNGKKKKSQRGWICLFAPAEFGRTDKDENEGTIRPLEKQTGSIGANIPVVLQHSEPALLSGSRTLLSISRERQTHIPRVTSVGRGERVEEVEEVEPSKERDTNPQTRQ